MEKNLTINVVLDTKQATGEAQKLFDLLSGKTGTETGGGRGTVIQSETVRKEVENTKKYLLDEQRNTMQSSENWERYSISVKEASIVKKELDKTIATRGLIVEQQDAEKSINDWNKYAISVKGATDAKKLMIQATEKRALLIEQQDTDKSIADWNKYSASVNQASIAQKKLMSELNAARSVRTTPYQFIPIDPKQLVTIKAMGTNLGVLRNEYKMTEAEIKALISVYQQLSKAVAASNTAMVSTRIKDIRAGVIVKGQGEQLGAGYVSEQTVRDMDALLKKFPQLQGHIQSTGVNLDRYHSKISKLVQSTKNYIKFQVGWFLGAGVIFGAIGAVVSAAKEVVVFDQSLRDLQAVTGATSQEVNILADTAKRVSKETPLAATEIVKLGLQLMRAGLDIETTTGAMEAAAKVATISGEDLKTVADTMASVFMIWKLGAADATRAGTVLAAALNYSKLNIEDFGTALNYVGGMAATMGISLEETAGVLASISNLGVRASTMATGWRIFVAEMAAPSARLNKYLSDVHANFNKLNITKIEGPHKMATILAELERVGFGTQQALSLLERRTAAFFLAIKTVGVPALLTMEEKMSDQRAYTEGLAFAMQGLSNQVKNLKNHIFLTALNIGQVLLPALKVMVSIFTTLASVLAHSVSFFTSFPGVILPIVATFGFLVMILKDLLIVQKSVIIALAITAWQQSIVIINHFIAAIATVIGNLSTLREVMKSLWIIMAKNPLGLIVLAITAIVGSAFINWLIKGQSEFEKLGSKADKLTKSQEEMRKKGEELRKLYPELFQEMAKGAEGAADAMTLYKKRIDEALNVPTFKAPELPNNIKEWIDENLVPSITEIKEFREELDRLQKQITKLTTEPIEVGFLDVIKALGKGFVSAITEGSWYEFTVFMQELENTISMFAGWMLKLLQKIGEGWEVLGATVGLFAMKVKTALTGGGTDALRQIDQDYSAQLDSIRKKWDEWSKDIVKDIAGAGALLSPKKIWFEFIESIRASKTPEAKKQLEEFTKDYKKTLELSNFANAEFKRIVAEGNFSKMLEQIITATKKLTSEERKKIAFENLTKMIADVASADPDRLKAVLLGMAEAYAKAREKFEKADKGTGKRIAAGIADVLRLESDMFKDRLQSLKLMQAEELKALEHQNDMEVLTETAATTQLQATIEERTWILQTFYKEGITSAKDYYDEKQSLLKMSFDNEIKIIQAQTERSLGELEQQGKSLIEQQEIIYERINQQRENVLRLGGTSGLNLVNLQMGGADQKAIAAALEKVPKLYRDIIKDQIKQIGDWDNELAKIGIRFIDLQNKGGILAEQGIQKVTEATIKNAEALRKLNYEQQIALALEPYEKQKFINEKQSEYNKLMIEANEIAGNWTEAEVYKLKLLENETKKAQLAIDSVIAKTKAEIIYQEAILETINACDLYSEAEEKRYESIKKNIEALKESLPLYEEISKATTIVGGEKLAEQELKMADSVGYALKKVNDEWADHAKYVRELTNDLYRDAAKSFSDLFYDSITGKLKSLTDYFKNFCNIIARYFTDMLGRMSAMNLQQSIMGTAGQMMPGVATAGTQGGLLGAGGALSGISPYIMPALGGGLIGSQFGGYGGIGGALGGIGGAVLLTGVGTTGMGLIGGGLTSALMAGGSGAMSGALAGSIVPIIGTIIGAVLGALIGSLFGGGHPTTPQMEMRYGYEPGIKHMEPTGAYGDSRWQTTEGKYGFWSKKMGEQAEAFGEDAIKVFQKIREKTKSIFEDFKLDTSGFDKEWYKWIDGLEKMTAEQQQAAFKGMIAEYITFATEGQINFKDFRKEGEELLDTIDRIMTALVTYPDILDSFQDYIDAVKDSKDDYAKYKDVMRESDKNIGDLWDNLQEATDPTDAIQYATELKTAIYDRYTFEKNLIEGLVNAIAQINIQINRLTEQGVTFLLDMQGKVDQLRGTFLTYQGVENVAPYFMEKVRTAATPEEKLASVNYYQTLIDKWLSSKEADITAKWQKAEAAANAQAQQASQATKEALQGEVEAQQKQLQIIQGWKSLLDNIKTTILKLTTSTASPADVLERLSIQQQAIQRMKELYQGVTGEERLKYAGDIYQMEQDLLAIGQEAYQRPSPEYRALFDSVVKDLQVIQGDAEKYASLETDILAEIESLQRQSNITQAKSVSYQSQMNAELQAVRNQAATGYEWLMTEGAKAYAAAIIAAEAEKTSLEDTLKSIIGEYTVDEYLTALGKITISGFELVAKTFKDVMQDIFKDIDFSNINTAVPLQHGIARVPYDNFLASLHMDEEVVPASERGKRGNVINISISPEITIHASGDAKPTEIAKETRKEILYSIRYNGELREEIKDLVHYG